MAIIKSTAFFLVVGISVSGFAFEFKSVSKKICDSTSVPVALPKAYRSKAIRQCEKYTGLHAKIVSKLRKLDKLRPYTEEKLKEEFGSNWRSKLTATQSEISQLEEINGDHESRMNLSPTYFPYLQLDKNYLKSLKAHNLDLLDQSFGAVISDQIKVKDYETAKGDTDTLELKLQHEGGVSILPRVSYLTSFMTCTVPQGYLVDEKDACEKMNKNKRKYMELIKSDLKDTEKSSKLPSHPGAK